MAYLLQFRSITGAQSGQFDLGSSHLHCYERWPVGKHLPHRLAACRVTADARQTGCYQRGEFLFDRRTPTNSLCTVLPKVGLEPTPPCGDRILRPARVAFADIAVT